MHSKFSAVLWLSAFGIALLSTYYFEFTLLQRFKQYGFVSYIFSPLTPLIINPGSYNQRRTDVLTCDESKWKSRLISEYDVKLVLTVDLNGSCANFSSVQEAVDVVPNFSNTRTLILINSGTYRFSFVCICFCLCSVINKMIFYFGLKYLKK